MTTIKTADLHLELPRPTPPDTVVGELVIAGDSRWATSGPHFGFRGPRAPANSDTEFDHPEHLTVIDREGRRHPGSEGSVFGTWPTYEAALDAAWQAYAAAMAATVAGQFDRMVEALKPIERDAVLAAEARRARAADLHQCERCRTTFRGQAPTYIVLEEHTLVDVESSTGKVVYSGEASSWAPALVASLTARYREGLGAAQADHRRALAARDAEHAADLEVHRWWVRVLLALAATLALVLAYSRG